MRRLTPIRLADNAYRTLGLSASADQAAVENAARRMRIWTDTRRIPPTPWDLLWLGPLSRSRSDIDLAISRINDPATRVCERLLWFHGPTPPTLAPPPLNPDPDADDERPAEHDAALLGVCAAGINDPGAADFYRWRQASLRWLSQVISAHYTAWSLEVESAGNFEKRASDEEVESAVAGLPSVLADALSPAAESAFKAGEYGRCAGIADLVEYAAGFDPTSLAPDRLLDCLEAVVRSRCQELDDWLRPQIYRDAPAHNAGVAAAATVSYAHLVQPTLDPFCQIARGRPDPLLRARTQAARLLVLIALGWEKGERYTDSVDLLHRARELADGSPAMVEVETALQRCAPFVEPARLAMGDAAPPLSLEPIDPSLIELEAAQFAVFAARRPSRRKHRSPVLQNAAIAISISIAAIVMTTWTLTMNLSSKTAPALPVDSSTPDGRDAFERKFDIQKRRPLSSSSPQPSDERETDPGIPQSLQQVDP